MFSERILIILILVTAAFIIALAAIRYRRGSLETAEPYGYVSEEDEYTSVLQRAREDLYDTRTLAQLASDCPACGGDHPGLCEALSAAQRALAEDDAITGTIMKAGDLPPEPEPEPADPRVSRLWDEFEHEWHCDGNGQWHAPAALLYSLADDDWLRGLLALQPA